MKQKAVLLIYGEGGHKAQMTRLYRLLKDGFINNEIKTLGICENDNSIKEIDINFSLSPLRDKYSYLKTLYLIPKFLFLNLKYFYQIQKDYDIKVVISTGPGISLILSILFKICGKRIIFLETWSRFEGKTMTGKIMYKFADKFYIQNKSLQKLYPNAIYGGLL
jgi:UDP-N-acetylglucosamine:LPS N-acetylglucosamine transferase